MPSSDTKDIIAIGGSAGSGAVLRTLVADLPATIFVSTHIAWVTGSLDSAPRNSDSMPGERAGDRL